MKTIVQRGGGRSPPPPEYVTGRIYHLLASVEFFTI